MTLRDNHAATIITAAATLGSHPDCRRLPIQIAALHRAECRKQVGIAEALKEHSEAVSRIMAEFRARMDEARTHFEAVKSDPSHPGFDAARDALDRLRRMAPNTRPANDALDRAIRQIEAEYRAEIQRLGQLYRVQNGLVVA